MGSCRGRAFRADGTAVKFLFELQSTSCSDKCFLDGMLAVLTAAVIRKDCGRGLFSLVAPLYPQASEATAGSSVSSQHGGKRRSGGWLRRIYGRGLEPSTFH